MTDLWFVVNCWYRFFKIDLYIYSFEDNAEQKCESAILDALAIDASSLDANQALASFRLSQCKPDLASEAIIKVFNGVKEIRLREHSKSILIDLTPSDDNANDGMAFF